jgi:hypothetical protein
MALLLEPISSDDESDDEEGLPPSVPTIDSAWLTTEFVDLGGCVGGDGTRFPLHTWDLVYPVAQRVQTEIAEFCSVTLHSQTADTGQAAAVPGLAGASLWIRGHRSDGVPVELWSAASLDLSRSSQLPLTDASLALAFDAASWFRGVDLGALTPDSDGVIRFSSTSNPAFLQLVERQMGDDSVLRPRIASDDVVDD